MAFRQLKSKKKFIKKTRNSKNKISTLFLPAINSVDLKKQATRVISQKKFPPRISPVEKNNSNETENRSMSPHDVIINVNR